MTPTRSRRPPDAVVLAATGLAALVLSACSPTAPPGVDHDQLDAEVSRAIGDPASCLLIGKAGSGKVLYRYNTATVCDRLLDACAGGARMKVGELLDATAKDGKPRQLSCATTPDHSKGVGWASGPIAGTDLVYAGAMEGDRTFPGRMMAERLEAGFRRAKVSKAP
ncbi:MAG TPA: hypothetical protein VFH92_12890 [Phenylobacterium sp.]|nr:hypothetical protein [Phenylobacterium sp.]